MPNEIDILSIQSSLETNAHSNITVHLLTSHEITKIRLYFESDLISYNTK